jgi:2-polyprenyl-3-methyl-5-hydroxy-6-metoxy-1,4-benzoquinol methylase
MQTSDPAQAKRAPHAILDASSRNHKAQKIAAILARRLDLRGKRILDIGAGSGHIAGYFAAQVGPEGEVLAVDRVSGETLPFSDSGFDIVITNHVIEHVGLRDAQLRHLQEIARVLKPGGLVYLAVPNRWQVMEHHFRLPLLSWLPLPLASAYVRLTRRGSHYDCTPLSRRALLGLFREAGLSAQDVTLEALRLMARDEMTGPKGWILARLPSALLRPLMTFIPTHVFTGTPIKGAAGP